MQQQVPHNPATRLDIAKLIRTDDAGLIERIAATRVTYAELLEAYLQLDGEIQADSDASKSTKRLTQVIAILSAERARAEGLDE